MLSRTTGKEDLRGSLGDVEVVGVRKRGTPDAVGLVYRGRAGRSLRPAGRVSRRRRWKARLFSSLGLY